MKTMLIYLVAINFVTFIIFGIDKFKAIKKKWRVRESVLLGLSAVGGCIGGLAAMYIFRHKTKTPIFQYGMPIIFILQIAITVYLAYKGIIL